MELKVSDIIKKISSNELIGNPEHLVTEIRSVSDSLTKSSLFWCSDKNAPALESIQQGVGIISTGLKTSLTDLQLSSTELSWVVVENPRRAFMEVMSEFFTESLALGDIHPSANIDSSVEYDRSKVRIGANVVIEKNVHIGNGSIIHHNTVIFANSVIGNNTSIGSNCTIGGVGFGYELNDDNQNELIPHIGNVVLSDGVEIGNNVCVDRAVLGSTFLDENVKIDNLVHIAHGVKIGKNSLIIANSMIAGSVVIGENVWISPSASILQKVTIGDNSVIGMGSVVILNVDESTVVAGVPAKKIKDK